MSCQTNIPCLLLIIRLRFTSGEKKIWQSNENSQNIMSMVVDLWTLKYQNWLSFEISCCQQYKINFNFDTF